MNEKDNWPEKQKRLWQLRAREDAREEEGDKGETGQKGDNRGSQVWSWWGTKMTYGDLDSCSIKKKKIHFNLFLRCFTVMMSPCVCHRSWQASNNSYSH